MYIPSHFRVWGFFVSEVLRLFHVRPTKPLCRVYPLAAENNAREIGKCDGGADRGEHKAKVVSITAAQSKSSTESDLIGSCYEQKTPP